MELSFFFSQPGLASMAVFADEGVRGGFFALLLLSFSVFSPSGDPGAAAPGVAGGAVAGAGCAEKGEGCEEKGAGAGAGCAEKGEGCEEKGAGAGADCAEEEEEKGEGWEEKGAGAGACWEEKGAAPPPALLSDGAELVAGSRAAAGWAPGL